MLGHITLPTLETGQRKLSGPQWGTHLTIQLDVLCEECVGLGERAAQAARVRIQQVLDRVHLIILHKMLPVLELWVQQP